MTGIPVTVCQVQKASAKLRTHEMFRAKGGNPPSPVVRIQGALREQRRHRPSSLRI
jgi:hypothetical protein